MKIVYDFDRNLVEQLHSLYKEEWWTKARTLDDTQRVVEASQINIGLIDESGALLAYARVLTDYTYKAIIFDFIVNKDHRKRGLGDMLLNALLSDERLVRVEHVELYCLPEMQAYYLNYGFSADVSGLRLMRK